ARRAGVNGTPGPGNRRRVNLAGGESAASLPGAPGTADSVHCRGELPVPSLIKPKSKRKGQPTRVSSVFHIRYFCRFRRRSVVISTGCKSRHNAEKCLREFCDLLECGEVGRENPFLLRRRQRVEEADRLAIEECLTAFESDLRAGRVRNGKRKAVSRTHADLVMGRVRKIVEGCGIRRASDLCPDTVNRLLDRLQQEQEIKTAQTRKHYER